jgi:hypothetical protein
MNRKGDGVFFPQELDLLPIEFIDVFLAPAPTVTFVIKPFEGIKPLVDGKPERVVWMMSTERSLVTNSQKRPCHGLSSEQMC